MSAGRIFSRQPQPETFVETYLIPLSQNSLLRILERNSVFGGVGVAMEIKGNHNRVVGRDLNVHLEGEAAKRLVDYLILMMSRTDKPFVFYLGDARDNLRTITLRRES